MVQPSLLIFLLFLSSWGHTFHSYTLNFCNNSQLGSISTLIQIDNVQIIFNQAIQLKNFEGNDSKVSRPTLVQVFDKIFRTFLETKSKEAKQRRKLAKTIEFSCCINRPIM